VKRKIVFEDDGVCPAGKCQVSVLVMRQRGRGTDLRDNNRSEERAKRNCGNLRKAFFVGGNSTCRAHIRQHYELYQRRCKEQNIPENHHAIPRPIWRQMQLKKKDSKAKTQGTLDGVIEMSQGPREFTREGVLHAVTQFVACDDQVSFKNVFKSRKLLYLLCC
jgi:hypothetical protein